MRAGLVDIKIEKCKESAEKACILFKKHGTITDNILEFVSLALLNVMKHLQSRSGDQIFPLQHVYIHKNIVAEASPHNKEVEDLMTAEICREAVEDLQL